MKSNNNNTKKNRRISQILIETFDSNKKKDRKKDGIQETIKNSDLYKKNIISSKERIIFFYKMKYSLKKKISSIYLDTSTNYNKMIINNILTNRISVIKEKYTEMLNEIESNDLLIKYIPKKNVHFYLKYLVVVYDKFYIPYPNYFKDIYIYSFMSQYLLKKQKILDETKENNKYIYIQQKIQKLFSNNPKETKILSSHLSSSDSENENFGKSKYIKGHDIDAENSQKSLDKLQDLLGKFNEDENKKHLRIYIRARSKSIKNIDTLFINYFKLNKPKKIKWKELYEIQNKKIMRNKKRKGTEVKINRNKVVIEKVVEKYKNKKILNKKTTIEERRKTLIDKKNEITEIKRILTQNDVGKNNKILDVVKRGFLFINDNEKNKNNNKTNLLIRSYNKNDIKCEEDKIDTNKDLEIKIKQILHKLSQNNHNHNYYYGENTNLLKKQKYIIKNLNDCLNEYRFYNTIINNSVEKQNYYEKKVIPGLFNNKVNILNNNQNLDIKIENSNKQKNYPSIMNFTPVRTKYSDKNTYTFCKKLYQKKNIYPDKKVKLNLLVNFNNKNRNYTERILFENEKTTQKIINNQMERLENSIYHYYKTLKNQRKPLTRYKLNNYNNINLSDINSKNKIKNKKNENIVMPRNKDLDYYNNNSNRKIQTYVKKNKDKLLIISLNNDKSINNIINDNIYSKDKNNESIKKVNKNTFFSYNNCKNQKPIKINFSKTLTIRK